MDVGSTAATIFAVWYSEVAKLISRATNGAIESALNVNWLLKVFNSSSVKADPACEGDCIQFAARALERAVERLHAGKAVQKAPRWGLDVHQATFVHLVLGKTPLKCLVDRSTAHGGDDSTVNVGHFDWTDNDLVQSVAQVSGL